MKFPLEQTIFKIVARYGNGDCHFLGDLFIVEIYQDDELIVRYDGLGCWNSAKGFSDGLYSLSWIAGISVNVEYERVANVIV